MLRAKGSSKDYVYVTTPYVFAVIESFNRLRKLNKDIILFVLFYYEYIRAYALVLALTCIGTAK